MNQFLRQLDITFRRDPTNYRPRINKVGGGFFFLMLLLLLLQEGRLTF
jgi:hypothetical protein